MEKSSALFPEVQWKSVSSGPKADILNEERAL